MANLNKVIIMGNLTRDPEMRVTPKGTALCSFGLAINREWKNDAGEKQQETTFVDVEAWGKQAEVISKYCTKGKGLLVEGRLKFEQWEDKTSGQKRSKLKVILEQFQFIGGRDAGESGPGTSHSADEKAAGYGSGHRQPPKDTVDEDVPF